MQELLTFYVEENKHKKGKDFFLQKDQLGPFGKGGTGLLLTMRLKKN